MNRGWVKLWRKISDTDIIQNHVALALFIWMMVKANHKTRSFCSRGARIELEPGQLLFGRDKAAKAIGTTPRKIRTAIKYLLKTEKVTSTSTNRGTVVTIVNWHLYQSASEANDQHIDQEATSRRPAGDHSEEVKEVKEQNQEAAEAAGGGEESAQGGSDTKAKAQAIEIPEELDTPAFRTAWADWYAYRREAKIKTYVPRVAKAQLTKLAKLGHDAAIAAIEHSISQGYAGIYPPKTATGSPVAAANTTPEIESRPFIRISNLAVSATLTGLRSSST